MTTSRAVATLATYIISVFFSNHPVSIPTPNPMSRIPINLTTAPIILIAFLWATQCIDATIICNGIIGREGVKPYNILILYLSLAYITTTLDITDILWTTLSWVSNKGGQNGRKVYLYFYLIFTLFSILLGNDSVITTGTAFLVQYTYVSRLEHKAWIMATFAAANTGSILLFVGNPTNVVVSETFHVNLMDLTLYSILPFIACLVPCFGVLALQHRHQVPARLHHATHRYPRPAWDPVGAMLGGVLLGATLFSTLIGSFFGISVWMTSLPFAVVKALFDLCRDYHRYSHGISMLGRTSPRAILQTNNIQRSRVLDEETTLLLHSETLKHDSTMQSPSLTTQGTGTHSRHYSSSLGDLHDRMDRRFPTFTTTLRRMPFALVLFAFSQFILVEALDHQGWVNVFAHWFIRACGTRVQPTIWIAGALGVFLPNLLSTNLATTILLAKVAHAAALPYHANLGVAIALVVASHVGAVGLTFSASSAGLLLRATLRKLGIPMSQQDFTFRNLLPLVTMTITGLLTVCGEMSRLSTEEA